MNLRHLEDGTHDIQNHLDEHHQLGEDVLSVIPRQPPSAHLSPLPQALPYKLIAAHFPHPKSSPNDILAFREIVAHNSYEKQSHLFGPLITDSWIEEEEETGASSVKERRRKLTGPLGRLQSSRTMPKLGSPPLLQALYPSRYPSVSVGFHSPGFHQKAYSAFEKAELEDMDMDEA
ncbi:unnamed protein product [Rhizoctonia solani]|uniref:Uncharacterized protein n=1 Tax=Rhizoctonia solani TaxID=456999 RepID=A0A8H2XQS3_9AGAM|nr:unnamed protein product [Rhizoctonia solani]